jgi:hypothetical protein
MKSFLYKANINPSHIDLKYCNDKNEFIVILNKIKKNDITISFMCFAIKKYLFLFDYVESFFFNLFNRFNVKIINHELLNDNLLVVLINEKTIK